MEIKFEIIGHVVGLGYLFAPTELWYLRWKLNLADYYGISSLEEYSAALSINRMH